MSGKRKKPRASTLRTLSALGVVGLVCLGLAVHAGVGTPSALGIGDIAALCPLGGLEAMIASKAIVPPMLIGLGVVVVLTLLVGRAFCAWGCPVTLMRKVSGRGAGESGASPLAAGGIAGQPGGRAAAGGGPAGSLVAAAEGEGGPGSSPAAAKEKKEEGAAPRPSRFFVLGATLLTTAAFGFPVFCLVCPVGLTFGTLVVVWRLFQFSEVTWSLLVFPAILVLELVVLRKWCHRFCPLGALLSLIARGNRTFRPQANADACLHAAHGERCNRCADVCPEGVNLHDKTISAPMNECVKCRACADACPMHAITFPLLAKAANEREGESQ
ncbi:4Fe-4S binding protein [Eggerthella sinensis]|uniref:4Fe-4S binding protein n=1 Tax=Eggerthella sinensis TaxID=242230 RepID=UPI00248F140C|nr:4Fe-4S binding protein [Eggerthella sinensis]